MNFDLQKKVEHSHLVVGSFESDSTLVSNFEGSGISIDEGRKPYFYPDGPEFRIEYIHDRVEF